MKMERGAEVQAARTGGWIRSFHLELGVSSFYSADDLSSRDSKKYSAASIAVMGLLYSASTRVMSHGGTTSTTHECPRSTWGGILETQLKHV